MKSDCVIHAKCIERMYKNGVVVSFLLEDLYGVTKLYTYEALLESIKNGRLNILNLKLTSDNKIRKFNNSIKDTVILTFKSICRWITCWLGLSYEDIIYDTDFVGDCEYIHALITMGKDTIPYIDVSLDYKDKHGILNLNFSNSDEIYLSYVINGGLDHHIERIKRKVKKFVYKVKTRYIDFSDDIQQLANNRMCNSGNYG